MIRTTSVWFFHFQRGKRRDVRDECLIKKNSWLLLVCQQVVNPSAAGSPFVAGTAQVKGGKKKKRKEVYIALWEIPFETSHKLVRLLLEDVYLYGKWKKKRISESGYGGDAQMGLDIMYKPIDSKEGAQHRIKKRLNSENVFTTDGLFLRLFDTIMRHWYWTLFFHSCCCWPAVISIQVTRPPSNSSYRTTRKKTKQCWMYPFSSESLLSTKDDRPPAGRRRGREKTNNKDRYRFITLDIRTPNPFFFFFFQI